MIFLNLYLVIILDLLIHIRCGMNALKKKVFLLILQFKKTENVFYETLLKPEPNGVSPEEVMDKERNQEEMPEDVSRR